MPNRICVIIGLSGFILGGCEAFTPPLEIPTKDVGFTIDQKPYHYVSTISDRRVVVFDKNNVCMEPPPDTTENISSQLTGALKGSGSTGTPVTVSGEANASSQIASILANVNPTTQGIYWFRTVAANYCIAYMNGAMSKTEYGDRLAQAAIAALQTVNTEIIMSGGKIGSSDVRVASAAATPPPQQPEVTPAKPSATTTSATTSSASTPQTSPTAAATAPLKSSEKAGLLKDNLSKLNETLKSIR